MNTKDVRFEIQGPGPTFALVRVSFPDGNPYNTRRTTYQETYDTFEDAVVAAFDRGATSIGCVDMEGQEDEWNMRILVEISHHLRKLVMTRGLNLRKREFKRRAYQIRLWHNNSIGKVLSNNPKQLACLLYDLQMKRHGDLVTDASEDDKVAWIFQRILGNEPTYFEFVSDYYFGRFVWFLSFIERVL